MSVMTTPTHGMAYQAPLGAGEGVKASTSDLSCHFALHIPNIHKKDPQGKPDFKVVFLDMCAPPSWGMGRGSKFLEVTFLAILPFIHQFYLKRTLRASQTLWWCSWACTPPPGGRGGVKAARGKLSCHFALVLD